MTHLPAEIALDLELDESQDADALRRAVAGKLGLSESSLPELVLLKRSIDARRGRVRFHLVVGLAAVSRHPLGEPNPREIDRPDRVAIVGDGPAGLFCAYELARRGIGSTVYDRGKLVRPRRRDLRGLHQEGRVDVDSNYCFGEGGAGTYSDGKLYTRSHKRGDVRDILEVLVRHGAPHEILVDARPHIGSNRLPRVVTALRDHLESVGVRFVFGARVVSISRDGLGHARGVRLADGAEHGAEAIVLAAGHSARNLLAWLADRGVPLEPKGFAVGVRIEHPQSLIDRIQYGRQAGHARLPSASYRLAHTEDGRGVFSFCMCPGGFVVPAATEPDGVVVNGMSLSKRDSPFANSGIVLAVEPVDLARAGFMGPLAGIDYQRALERYAYQAGGGGLRAPAARVTDFVAGKGSSSLGPSSYRPGLAAVDLGDVLDAAGMRIAASLRASLRVFGRKMRGYLTEEAVMIGVESRSSSPVRIPRHPHTLESIAVPRLYPCGEGAGYAGGIVSAALDGLRVARSLAATL